MDHSMFLERFCFKGVGEPGRIIIQENFPATKTLKMETSARDMGLVEKYSNDNLHRVFADSPENSATLKRLVAAQDLAEYARLIGISPKDFYDLKKKIYRIGNGFMPR